MLSVYSKFRLPNHLITETVLFFFNDTATTEIYTLSLHDALPILDEISAGPYQLFAGRTFLRLPSCRFGGRPQHQPAGGGRLPCSADFEPVSCLWSAPGGRLRLWVYLRAVLFRPRGPDRHCLAVLSFLELLAAYRPLLGDIQGERTLFLFLFRPRGKGPALHPDDLPAAARILGTALFLRLSALPASPVFLVLFCRPDLWVGPGPGPEITLPAASRAIGHDPAPREKDRKKDHPRRP